MIKNTLFLSAALVFSAACFCQNSGKLVLAKGQKYTIENKFSAIITQTMMGQPMESKAEFNTTSNVEVKDEKEDNYNLVNTYVKITANISAMGQDMNFDSDKKEDMEGEMGSGMKDLIGVPKNVAIDKNGKIIPDNKDTTSKGSAAGMMSMMMSGVTGSPEETGYGLSTAFLVIPSKASVGFTWGDSTTAEGGKKSTIYTLKEIKGTEAVVIIAGTLNVEVKTEMQGQQIANKSTGKISGEELVDLTTGLIKQRNTTMESTGTLEAMGQEIPTTTKITTATTIKTL